MHALGCIALIGLAAGLAGCGSYQRFSVHGQPPAASATASVAAVPADYLEDAPVRRPARRARAKASVAAAPDPETTGSTTPAAKPSTEAEMTAQRREREIRRSLKSICSNC